MSSSGGDDRFLKVKRDPRFWEMPEKERRIKIDKRFKSMFTDKRFKLKYTVDKRGRPVNHTSTEDLKRFYNLSDTEEDEEDEEETTKTKVKEKEVKKKKEKKKTKVKEVKEESGSVTAEQSSEETQKGGLSAVEPPQRGVRVVEEGEDDDEDEDEDEAEQRDEVAGSGDEDDDGNDEDDDEGGSGSDDEDGEDSEDSGSDSEEDLARGIGNVETSSDEDDHDDQQGGPEDVDSILRKEEEEITHDWGELCKDAPRSEQISSRLAVCNMDWDKIKAKDLLFVFNSFKPKGGVVISVKIYPSEFGKERRELERSQGPMELMALPEDPDNDSHEQQVYREKLRDYQFKRLQYFYAVVECDSSETADSIYQSCDRSEYESSCSVLDLRFIPDEVSFEEEEPTDVATEVGVSSYTPKMFTCAASGTSTVKLTWDENDHDRVTALSRDFKKDKLLDMDFQAYLASSSEEEGGEGEGEGGWGALEFPEDKTPEETKVQELKEEVLKPRQKKQRAEQQISKYRELLKGIQDKEKKHDKHMEMEVTWTPGLRQTTEQLVKQKKQQEVKGQLTPWEEYLEKKKNKKKLRRDKKKKQEEPTEEDLSDDEVPSDVDLNDPFFTEELGTTEVKKKTKGKKSKKEEEERTAEEEEELENRKAEMALLMDDVEDGERKHFNYDEIVELQNLSKKKRKTLKKNNQPLEEDSFQVDVKDPRFQAVFTSALFNLDPSDPHYKKTKATQSILEEKERRRHAKGTGEEEKDRRHAKGTDEEKKKKRPHEDTTPPTPPTQEAHGSSRKQETEGRKQEALLDPSLSLLVKNIKSKTQQFQARKKHKAS